jgi:hypothetical protein
MDVMDVLDVLDAMDAMAVSPVMVRPAASVARGCSGSGALFMKI